MERASRATNEENKMDRAQKIRVETLEEFERLPIISEIASLCNLAKYPLGGTSALAVICTLVDAMK